MTKQIDICRNTFQVYYFVISLALLICAASHCYSLYRGHEGIRETSRTRAEIQLAFIANRIDQQIEEIDRVLLTTQKLFAVTPKDNSTHTLQALCESISGLRSLQVLNTVGHVTASNDSSSLGMNLSQSTIFSVPNRQQNPNVLYISEPTIAQNGAPGITLSKVIVNPKGQYLGVVTAYFELHAFKKIMAEILNAENVSVALIRGNNLPVIGVHAEENRGGGLSLAVISHAIKPKDVTMNIHLHVNLAQNERALYGNWRQDAILNSILLSLLALIIIFSLYWHYRHQTRLNLFFLLQRNEQQNAEFERRKLSQAIDQSATAVLITDANGTIEYANPAACDFYGLSSEEILGVSSSSLVSSDMPNEIFQSMLATIHAGNTWRGHLTNSHVDGRIIQEAVTISPVRNESGQITHFVSHHEDITAEHEHEQARKEIESREYKIRKMEALTAMASGLAHDFNNILVVILGFSKLGQTMLATPGGISRLSGYFDEIEIAGERAKTIVQQLLTYSRGVRLRAEPVDTAGLVREVINQLTPTLLENISVSTQLDEHLPMLTIAPLHLHQILFNLCTNARDAIVQKGHIEISIRVGPFLDQQDSATHTNEYSGEYFRISVKDNGSGIPKEAREHVLEPFFTTKKLGKGTGMGLAVVHGICRTYGGHLQLCSEVGQGTEVLVYLPLKPASTHAVYPNMEYLHTSRPTM